MKTPIPLENAVTYKQLLEKLPDKPLFNSSTSPHDDGIGWLLSPEPMQLSCQQLHKIKQIGRVLQNLARATEKMYKLCLKDPKLNWLQPLFENGKPQELLNYGKMNRFKRHLPQVIRPDLLITPKGFTLCEVDSVPGGIGFTASLQKAYKELGFTLAGDPDGLEHLFLKMLLALSPENKPAPNIAIIVSDESQDYRLELQWLTHTIKTNYTNIHLIHPNQVQLNGQTLGFTDNKNQFTPIDIIYRFFELFDLPNIPQIELIQYAVKKGMVAITPPFKPWLEEKFVLALVHHPFLEDFWLSQLVKDDLALLQEIIPQSWILDPSDIPPFSAVVPELNFSGKRFQNFAQLNKLTQKQRELVIKPSGFSPLAWGSRGVVIGHDVPQIEWEKQLDHALCSYEQTPHLLQRFENTLIHPYRYFNTDSGEIIDSEGRTRLCPYFFLINDEVQLAGILSTTCPKNKKIIHGMREGVMRPVLKPSEDCNH